MDLTVNARVPYISFRNLPRGHSNICKYKTHLFSNSITLIFKKNVIIFIFPMVRPCVLTYFVCLGSKV